ncbi:hypothetical protein POM88_047480 [Heracleum sosnowskyi]|uniref:Secreted protein n=1 Tax=Heracleum sosnowskyi TaxID=360622 RepID=A0AAD8GTZ4_9APIA|nr:hypothetical protein POM88_047480 [Heracleum sosnowskyi]
MFRFSNRLLRSLFILLLLHQSFPRNVWCFAFAFKEKLKEKKPTLTDALTQTLQAMYNFGCLNLADIVEVGGLIPSWITKAGDVHDSVLHCTCFATSVTEDGSAVTTLAPRILLRRCCCGAGAEELNLLSQLMLSHCCCGIY